MTKARATRQESWRKFSAIDGGPVSDRLGRLWTLILLRVPFSKFVREIVARAPIAIARFASSETWPKFTPQLHLTARRRLCPAAQALLGNKSGRLQFSSVLVILRCARCPTSRHI